MLGNPKGFKSPTSVTVDTVAFDVEPTSILSDKLLVRSLKIQAPQITMESGGLDANNLAKILANLQSRAGGRAGSGSGASQVAGRKIQVDEFVMSGAQLKTDSSQLDGTTSSVPIPDIHFKDLGRGADGITPADLAEQVLQMVSAHAASLPSASLGKAGKGAGAALKSAAKAAVGDLGNAAKGVLDSLNTKN